MIHFFVLLFGVCALAVARLIQKSEIYQYKWGYVIFKADYPILFRFIPIILLLAGLVSIASGVIGLTLSSTRTPPALPSAHSHLPASSAPLSASVPVSSVR
jgi:hypothetical protein